MTDEELREINNEIETLDEEIGYVADILDGITEIKNLLEIEDIDKYVVVSVLEGTKELEKRYDDMNHRRAVLDAKKTKDTYKEGLEMLRIIKAEFDDIMSGECTEEKQILLIEKVKELKNLPLFAYCNGTRYGYDKNGNWTEEDLSKKGFTNPPLILEHELGLAWRMFYGWAEEWDIDKDIKNASKALSKRMKLLEDWDRDHQ